MNVQDGYKKDDEKYAKQCKNYARIMKLKR